MYFIFIGYEYLLFVYVLRPTTVRDFLRISIRCSDNMQITGVANGLTDRTDIDVEIFEFIDRGMYIDFKRWAENVDGDRSLFVLRTPAPSSDQ